MAKGNGGKGRSAGEGTVKKRKDGRHEARYLVPSEYRAVIERAHPYFCGKTEKEAKEKRTEAVREIHRRGPRNFDANRVTFGEWLERWTDSLPGQVLENTRGFYEHRCRAYLIPGPARCARTP